jgi:hypothetical protein
MSASAGKLKALIETPPILVLPGVFDGFSARLVKHAPAATRRSWRTRPLRTTRAACAASPAR